jgi:hypothetical protein
MKKEKSWGRERYMYVPRWAGHGKKRSN